MNERPIIFSAPMIRALLAGKKTQTRRVVKPQPSIADVSVYGVPEVDASSITQRSALGTYSIPTRCPYGVRSDRLWVREAFALIRSHRDWETGAVDDIDEAPRDVKEPNGYWRLAYAANDPEGAPDTREERGFSWRSPIHMPRKLSRITLAITEVRVQRAHDISEKDAWAEGIAAVDGALDDAEICRIGKATGWGAEDARSSFAALWCEIHGAPSWDANPWVWAISFEVVR